MVHPKSILLLLFANAIMLQSFAQAPKAAQHWSIEAFEHKLQAAGSNAQILDPRTIEEYTEAHLKGAVNFSIKNEAETQAAITRLNKENPVFVYSNGNGRSGQLAKKLREQNFRDVYELPGGISHWFGSGRPVDTKAAGGESLAAYKKLIASDKLVLVDIGSRFSAPCITLATVVDSVAKENPSGVKLVKIDFFGNRELVQNLHVEAIPYLILYKGNTIVWQKSGATPKAEIQAVINKNGGLN